MAQALENVAKFQTKCGSIIEQYLEERYKHSKNTAISYRGDLERLLEKVFKKSINTITVEEIDTIDYDLIMKYRSSMYENLANSTINRHMGSIKAILKHLKSRNILKSDISYLDSIKSLPNMSKSIEHMPFEVVMEFISAAGRNIHYPELKQNLMILAVDTGLRLDELLQITLSQFTVVGDTVLIKGFGKGNKEFTDRISIELYNQMLKTMRTGDNPKSKLFAPLNEKNVTDMMARIRNELGYQDREYSFHSFKKTAVTFTYRLTGDILEAQKKGRHGSLDTTRIYLKDEDYGVTGMFSLGSYDKELYKKVGHSDLLDAIEDMNKDFLHLLNIKLNSKKKI